MLYSTSDLKFEDILSLLPEGVWLDDFKDEIIKSLENTQIEIKSLKREMDGATVNADLIRKDFESLKQRSFVVEQSSSCSICEETLLFGENPFYIFPCKHYFHTDCLMQYMKKWCSSRAMKRAQELQKRILVLSQEVISTKSNESRQNLNLYRQELDSIIASECLLCGDRMIDSIDSGFIDYDGEMEEIESWK